MEKKNELITELIAEQWFSARIMPLESYISTGYSCMKAASNIKTPLLSWRSVICAKENGLILKKMNNMRIV